MSKNSSLSHRVTQELRRDIIAGVLQPGAWLKTDEVAARYAVSANPVREALWRLQGEGFVVANPNQGARVRTVDDDFIRNIFEIRESIEPIFVRRFCQRATPGDVKRLREAGQFFAEVAANSDPEFDTLDSANRLFHNVITEDEINLQAIEVIERYGGLINSTRAKLPISPVHLRQRATQHLEIVDAVAKGDADAAARLGAIHVRAACEDMLRQMRQVRMSAARAATQAGRAEQLSY
jgi:DNA-binding GntR family transcriptional regulator